MTDGPYKIDWNSLVTANGDLILRAVDGHVYDEYDSDPASLEIENAEAAAKVFAAPLMFDALVRIQNAVAKYLHPSSAMTKDQFIAEILAAADDKEVVRAVRAARGADNQDAPLSPSEGAAPQAKP